MSQDLVSRLRTKSIVRWIHYPGGTPEMRGHKPDPDCQEAAAEIERLRAVERRFNYIKAQFDPMAVDNEGGFAWYWRGSPACLRGETLAEAIDKALGVKPELKSCVWAQADSDTDLWETSCRRSFCLNEGTPAENRMTWCCYCGKPLEEHPWVDEEGAA